jgi:hypothetical protein
VASDCLAIEFHDRHGREIGAVYATEIDVDGFPFRVFCTGLHAAGFSKPMHNRMSVEGVGRHLSKRRQQFEIGFRRRPE